MTYASWTNQQIADPRWIKAGGVAGWVHTCALVWCDKQRTTERLEGGGESDWAEDRIHRDVARTIAPGVTPAETMRAINRLIRLGFWETDGRDHYRLVDFAEHTLDTESLQHLREKDAEKKKRQRHHREGFHDYCHKWDCDVIRGGASNRAANPVAKPRAVKPANRAAKPVAKPRAAKSPTTVYAEWHLRMAGARRVWIDTHMGVWGNMSQGWRIDGLPKFLAGDPEPDTLTFDEKHAWWVGQAVQSIDAHGGDEAAWRQDENGYTAFIHRCPEPIDPDAPLSKWA